LKLLHTADWHVGKTVRGRSRAAEHEAVLAEIVGVAHREAVDLVVVAGDLFDTAAPTPESERIVYQTLLGLSAHGSRPVVVVAGNHDNARRLDAVSPVFGTGSVHVTGRIARPDDGGVLSFDLAGHPVRVALLPFVSQRSIVTADQLMSADADQHALAYAERLGRITDVLASAFTDDAVNLVVAHAMVAGGLLGGGERSAHTIFDYAVPAGTFPVQTHYVALGHLHRTQRIDGPCPIWYPGSPLQMDFGEQADTKHVLVVDAAPGVPAKVTQVALESGRRFRTVSGTLAELAGAVVDGSDDFVRVIVREQGRVGLADEVRDLFPEAVDIRVEAPDADVGAPSSVAIDQRSPHELFADYLTAQQIDDQRLLDLFDQLHDQVLVGGELAGEEAGDAT
jgi:DNA repair protein SbcD/Mre11